MKPDFANASYNAAWTSEQLGNTAQAISYYKKAYDSNPTKKFLFALVDAQKDSGAFEEALATLSDFVANNPSDLEVQYAVVETHTEMGNADAAKTIASEILLQNFEKLL